MDNMPLRFRQFFFLLGFMLYLPPSLLAAEAAQMTIVSPGSADRLKVVYEEEIKPQFDRCSQCKVSWVAMGDGLNEKLLLDQVSKIKPETQVLVLDWNTKWDPSSKDQAKLIEGLKAFSAESRIIVATPGAPSHQTSAPFASSLLKQISDVVVVGDLSARDTIPQKSFFGPEMISAFRTKAEIGFGALQFAAKLTTHWNRKTPKEWLAHFQSVRLRSKKIWPELSDFFPY